MTLAVIRMKFENQINHFVFYIALAIESRANSNGFRSCITVMCCIQLINHSEINKILGVVGGIEYGLAHNASYARLALLILILYRNCYVEMVRR